MNLAWLGAGIAIGLHELRRQCPLRPQRLGRGKLCKQPIGPGGEEHCDATGRGTRYHVMPTPSATAFCVAAAPGRLGAIEQMVGAVIRASGIRIFGILGFGTEAIGQLAVGPVRPDRELSPVQVRDTWRGRTIGLLPQRLQY